MSDYRAVWRNLRVPRTMREAGLEEATERRTTDPFWAGLVTGMAVGAILIQTFF